jgi:hypothetical protein
MLNRVFRIFREKGGILKALDLWDWYESLEPKWQKKVKYYFSLKTIKNLNFPYKAKHFDREMFKLRERRNTQSVGPLGLV